MKNMPLGIGDALMVTLVGMLVVFLGLVILIFLIRFLNKVTANMGKKTVKITPTPLPPAFTAPIPAEPEEDDGALIAAITAAVACLLKEENKNTGFTVKHVRRISHAPAWQREGREAQINSIF